MLARERVQNTGLGLGVACPHVRAGGTGELFSAIGWTPTGIDYGAPDGKKVHLVVMYYIPDSQKGTYLKEVSALAGAIRKEGGIQPIASAEDLGAVRERLLDWVQAAIDASVPEAKARMIRLEARQAAVEQAAPAAAPGVLQVVPLTILTLPERHIVLCANAGLRPRARRDAARRAQAAHVSIRPGRLSARLPLRGELRLAGAVRVHRRQSGLSPPRPR